MDVERTRKVVEEEESRKKKLAFYKEAVAELDSDARGATRYRIREWKPIYTKILVLVQKGMTPAQIALEAEIGHTKRQISQLLRDPLFRLKLTQYNKKMDIAIIDRATEEMTKMPEIELAKGKLAEASEKAANTLLDMMNPKSRLYKRVTSLSERKALVEIARDILNRVGLNTVVSKEESSSRKEYSPDEIKSALSNAKELEAISSRLNNETSSYVLTTSQRKGVEDAQEGSESTQSVEENGPPGDEAQLNYVTKDPSFEQTAAFEQTERI